MGVLLDQIALPMDWKHFTLALLEQSFEKGQDKERAGRPDRVHTGIQNELCSGAIPDSCNLSRSTSSFQAHSPSKLHHFTSCSHCVVSDS